ncbi:HPP family-domain-containing protein [Xylariaceae sp. FL0804]|nr:HPP family-domain-containing protein [Xylariaceae sp. FL0804]
MDPAGSSVGVPEPEEPGLSGLLRIDVVSGTSSTCAACCKSALPPSPSPPRPSPLVVMVANVLAPLPPWLTRWVGYRAQPPKPINVWLTYVWAFIGAFGSLSVLMAVFGHSHYFTSRAVPPLIASYGASAVLCFNLVEAPLAQPRALFGGHFLSALTGIIFCYIFDIHDLQDDDPVPRYAWLAASLASAVAILVMMFTKTTHPPAGATALLPITDAAINRMRWYLLPVILLSSTLMMSVALLNNNIQRRYPVFWWSPPPPKKPAPVLPMNGVKTDPEKSDGSSQP